jgi:serpin B
MRSIRHIILLGMGLLLPGAAFAKIADSANQFTTDLYAQMAQGDGNVFCSPLSVYDLLMLAGAGARGPTAAEMSTVLHADVNQDHGELAKLIAQLTQPSDDFQLHIANAMWAQAGYRLRPDFVTMAQTIFLSGLFNVDFANPDAAGQKINDWVSGQTNGKIPVLFPPGSLDSTARLVLTNAIYFKADWASKFPPDSPQGPFHVGGNADTTDCTMMHKRSGFDYMEGDNFTALQMPYVGGDVSMIVLLPKAVDGIKTLESEFNADLLKKVVGGLQPATVDVSLPKFKFNYAAGLGQALQSLGMRAAFSPGEADFSGIYEPEQQRLYIMKVRHVAYVAVDEKGTEAAAATGIEVGATVIVMPQIVFNADHPFIFVIYDHRSGTALFVGRMWDPTKKE